MSKIPSENSKNILDFQKEAPCAQEINFRYLDTGGQQCPICKSTRIKTTDEIDAESYSQSVECNTCGATWTDGYRLVEIVNLIDGQGKQIIEF